MAVTIGSVGAALLASRAPRCAPMPVPQCGLRFLAVQTVTSDLPAGHRRHDGHHRYDSAAGGGAHVRLRAGRLPLARRPNRPQAGASPHHSDGRRMLRLSCPRCTVKRPECSQSMCSKSGAAGRLLRPCAADLAVRAAARCCLADEHQCWPPPHLGKLKGCLRMSTQVGYIGDQNGLVCVAVAVVLQTRRV